MEFSNRYAPEHLIINARDAESWLPLVVNAGSVFLGPWTPESVGDYASGTNHVLPTYGYGAPPRLHERQYQITAGRGSSPPRQSLVLRRCRYHCAWPPRCSNSRVTFKASGCLAGHACSVQVPFYAATLSVSVAEFLSLCISPGAN